MSKHRNNSNMFPAPSSYNVADTFWLSTCTVLPPLKLGKGDWERGSDSYMVYFHENFIFLQIWQGFETYYPDCLTQILWGFYKNLSFFKTLVFLYLLLSRLKFKILLFSNISPTNLVRNFFNQPYLFYHRTIVLLQPYCSCHSKFRIRE